MSPTTFRLLLLLSLSIAAPVAADQKFDQLRAQLPGTGAKQEQARRLFTHLQRPFQDREQSLLPLLRKLARHDPRSVALGLIHPSPDVRRMTVAVLDYDWVRRMGLRDADPLVRWTAARHTTDPETAILELLDSDAVRGARQVLLMLPRSTRYRTLLRLLARHTDPHLVRWLAELPGPAARQTLRALARTGHPGAVRAMLQRGALEAAWQRLEQPLESKTELSALEAARALGARLAPDSIERLDRLISGWEKAKDPRLSPLIDQLSPLYDHLRVTARDPDPALERKRLIRLLQAGQGLSWMTDRHAWLADRLGRPIAGPELLRLELPRPGQLGLTLLDLLQPASHSVRGIPLGYDAFQRTSGLDLEAAAVASIWRAHPDRPAAALTSRFPLPGILSLGVRNRDRVIAFLARATGAEEIESTGNERYRIGRWALRFTRKRCLVGPHQFAIDDYLAAPRPEPSAGPRLTLPIHRWIAQAEVPTLLGAMAEEFIEARCALEVSGTLSGRNMTVTGSVSGLPKRIARLVRDKPAKLLAAPARLLPRDTQGVLLLSIAPEALVDLVRNWPLKWYQKPVGFLGGAQKEKLIATLTALGTEAGAALLADGSPVGFIQVDPSRALGILQRYFPAKQTLRGKTVFRRGTRHARLVGEFLVFADAPGALLTLGQGPFLTAHPKWRPGDAGVAHLFADDPRLGQLSPLHGHLGRRGTTLAGRMTHAPLIGSGVNRRLPEVTLRLIGAPTRPSAVTLQARLLGPWPGGPTPKTGRLRLTLKRHEKPGLGLVLAETTLRAGHARLRIDLTRAQLEAALFRSHGWRVVK